MEVTAELEKRWESRAMAETGKQEMQTKLRGETGVRSTRGVGVSVDQIWISTLPHLLRLAGNITGLNKYNKVNSSGVMVNGREWESNSSKTESRSGREEHLGKINLLPLGRGGGEVHLDPSKGDLISMDGQEQDLICKEVNKMKLHCEL